MDPDPSQMALARQLGADRVEAVHEPYRRAFSHAAAAGVWALQEGRAAPRCRWVPGRERRHDLNLANLAAFLSRYRACWKCRSGTP